MGVRNCAENPQDVVLGGGKPVLLEQTIGRVLNHLAGLHQFQADPFGLAGFPGIHETSFRIG